MDPASALNRLHDDLGTDLRVFVDVRTDDIEVKYVRTDINSALEGTTNPGAHEAHIEDIATAMLTPGGTASIRYTPAAIIVGLPKHDDDGTGFLLSLEPDASPKVDEFIDVLLAQGATIQTSTATEQSSFPDGGEVGQLND